MLRAALMISTLVLALSVVACGGGGDDGAGGNGGNTINGTLELNTESLQTSRTKDNRATFIGYECKGKGGYDDIGEGTKIVVRDGSAVIIATSELDRGYTVPDDPRYPSYLASSPKYCKFNFTVVNVPSN